ncbi:MAG: carbohydrate porin [Candidatus Vecturithrix sp.]|jgi:hypothetical protein|nr:carbohydrate porin [Candidatus Vecturithrix sp.]
MMILRYAKIVFIGMCAILLIAQGALAEMTSTMSISGDVETNTTAEFLTEEGDDGDTDTSNMTNDGRVKITFTGRTEGKNGWYGAAVAQPLVSTDGATDVDDAYVEFGTSSYAFRIGRYEAEDMMVKGEDTYIAAAPGAPERYQANYARGRFGNGLGHVAVHFKPSDALQVYLDGTIGHRTETDYNLLTEVDEDVTVNVFGIRPVVKFCSSLYTVKLGGDFLTSIGQDDDSDYELTRWGFGAYGEAAFDRLTVGVSVDRGTRGGTGIDNIDFDDEYTLSTFGYATITLSEDNALGLAAGYTMLSYDESDDEASNIEGYINFIHQLPVEGLKIKMAGSFSTASIEPEGCSDSDNTAFGFRTRLNYDF